MMPPRRRLTTTLAGVLFALAITACTPPPAPDPPVAAAPPGTPPAPVAPPSATAQPPSAPTASSSAEIAAPAPAPSAPVAAIPPRESGSPLVRAHAAFEKVRGGKPLKIGAEGPAVAALQAVLLFWNYPLTPADVTGRYDQKTAVAVFHYRLDSGLSERKGSGPASFEKEARTAGVFDKAALAMFEGRMGAAIYRVIRDIDLRRGVRFHVPAGTTAEAALGAIIPDPEKLKKARAWGATVTIDTADTGAAARGEAAAWISILDYACVSSTQLADATCKH